MTNQFRKKGGNVFGIEVRKQVFTVREHMLKQMVIYPLVQKLPVATNNPPVLVYNGKYT